MAHFLFRNSRVQYRTAGAGRPLIFLPGNTASSAAFGRELEHFSGRFQCAAIDFLGTGGSERISPWPRDWWGECAAQTAALIDHLEAGPAVLVGSSGGAVVALRTALAFPGKVAAVLADSFTASFGRELAERNVRQGRANPGPELEGFWRAMHGEDWAQVVEEDTRMLEAFAAEGGAWLPDTLDGLSIPVRLTASRGDTFLPDPIAEMSGLLKRIPCASLYLHHSGDHPFMWTAPQAFLTQLEALLTEIGR
jgi:pimeloyl-ACP methyl ester carboxylesterase